MKKILFFTLICLFGSTCALWEGKAISPSPAGMDISVMSYNIHVGKGMDGRMSLERINDDIQKAGADLIGLQELDRFTIRNPMDQAAELGKLSGFNIVFSQNIDYQGGEFGIAIMSRYPILDKRFLHYKQKADRESRGALAVKVHPDYLNISKPIWFITTHLGTDSTGEEQKNQVFELLDWMKDLEKEGYLIVSGDMNQTPMNPAMELFAPDFLDIWTEAGEGEGFTFNALEPSRRIDYLFIRRKDLFSCKKAFVLNSAASDHRPVIAQVVLK